MWCISTEIQASDAEKLSDLFENFSQSVSWCETQDESIWKVLGYTSLEVNLKEWELFLYLNGFDVSLQSETVEDQDWLALVYENLPAREVGPFWIYGSHIKDTAPSQLYPVHVDAATAFGSGEHETTQGCLRALAYLKEKNFTPQTALDMGCGSAILAIAMCKIYNDLPVLAVDNDPEAVRVAIENAKLNKCPSIQAQVSEGFESLEHKTYDVITANILARPLIDLAKDLSECLNKDSFLILSGLLNWQKEEVLNAYTPFGLELEKEIEQNNWCALILKKN